MEIKKLNSNDIADFRSLVEIFNIVFGNDSSIPNNIYLQGLLSNPQFMVFVIKVNEKVVGGLTIYILQGYYSIKPTAYIYDVGISQTYQGKGLGKELISEVCKFCKHNNFHEAYVEAEADDIDTVSFYKRTNFTTTCEAIHFTYLFAKD